MKRYRINDIQISPLIVGIDRGSLSKTKIVAFREHHHSFSSIQLLAFSCLDTVLDIEHYNFPNEFLLIHQFLVNDQFSKWLSKDANFAFTINYESNAHYSCMIKWHYQQHNFTLFEHYWFDLTQTASNYWKIKTISEAICTSTRCYDLLEGGNISWSEAQQMCIGKGGTLVTISSHEELSMIRMILRVISPLHSERMFVGLMTQSAQVNKHFASQKL